MRTTGGSSFLSLCKLGGRLWNMYCLSRKKTEATTSFLQEHGIRAIPYHAGLDSAHVVRTEIFMNEAGVVWLRQLHLVWVLTNLTFDMFSIQVYLETWKRTISLGRRRDGEPADAFMLYGLDDIRQRRLFIQEAHGDDINAENTSALTH